MKTEKYEKSSMEMVALKHRHTGHETKDTNNR